MSSPSESVFPKPKKTVREISVHNQKLSDPYFWLRERENPEVLAHLNAENQFTDRFMESTAALREKLYGEILGRIKETDLSVPVRYADYYYYSRTEQGKQYSIQCRKKGSLDAPEEILLDGNALAEGHAYFHFGAMKISPNQKLLAYSTDTDGSETYTLHVKDLETGQLFKDTIPKTASSLEWAADNKTFFYNTLDEAKRPYKLFRHTLGTAPSEDALVFHEKDEAYFLGIYKTKDRKFLVLHLGSKTTSECRFLDASRPESSFETIHPREKDMEYSIEHHEGRFFIVHNSGAVNFKLSHAPVSDFAKSGWKDFLPYRPEVKLEAIDVFKDYLVIYLRDRGLEKIQIMHLPGGESHFIEFPEPAYSAWGSSNRDYHSKILRFEYSSLVTPHAVYDYNMADRTRELKKQQEIPSGYDSSKYVSERILAKSHDGTEVPVSLVYRKGAKRDGSAPVFLYGYGSYGISMDPTFSVSRLSLLDRGFIFAIAHIRGGGDLGRPWYEDGKFLKKKNTFADFIAAAEHLIKEKYTSAGKIAICGGSAGGLLMGAVTNARPDLFKAVLAMVPFVDVLNTMLDPSLPLTVTEYEEWGNPADKEYFDYIASYSPYDNVSPKHYPSMLITGGLNDPRVSYWEPAKWTAKLRENNLAKTPILLKMEMGSGHGGPSGRYDSIKEIAFEYAFILKIFGIND